MALMLGVPCPSHASLPVLQPCKMPHGGLCGRLGKPGRSRLTPSLHMPPSRPAAPQSHARLWTPRKPLWQGPNPPPHPLQLRASPPHPTFKKQRQFCASRRAKAVLYRSGFASVSHCAARWISQGCKTLSVHFMHFSTCGVTWVVKVIPQSPHTLCPPNVLPKACTSSTAGPCRDLWQAQPQAQPLTRRSTALVNTVRNACTNATR